MTNIKTSEQILSIISFYRNEILLIKSIYYNKNTIIIKYDYNKIYNRRFTAMTTCTILI